MKKRMHVKEIEWLDKECKEAYLQIVSCGHSLFCFSHPCYYSVGDLLIEPLECVDTKMLTTCDIPEERIVKLDDSFKYKIKGKLKSINEGIVVVHGFEMRLNMDKIPKDIKEGVYIQFITTRIDVW